MSNQIGPYRVLDLSPGRQIWVNTLELSWTPHPIYGLLEVDVTVARQFIAEHKARTGESLSFTGFLAYLHGPRRRRGQDRAGLPEGSSPDHGV